jgi:HEAT repeat protein
MSLYSLAAISTNAQPVLLAELASQNPEHRDYAARAYYIYPMTNANTEAAVPLLIQNLEHTNYRPRYSAVRALGEIGAPRELILPALTGALEDAEKSVRRMATNTLQKIAPEVLTDAPAR